LQVYPARYRGNNCSVSRGLTIPYWPHLHGTVATAANIPFSITSTTITITKFTADIDDVDIRTYATDLVIVAVTLIAHFYFYFAVPAVAIRTTGKEMPA
jgi:hypothetical protein